MDLVPRKLQIRLLLAVTLAMVAGTMGLSFWTGQSQAQQLLHDRKRQVELLGRNLADGSAHSYVLEDYAALEQYLRQAVAIPGLRRVTATDIRGSVLSSLGRSSDTAQPVLLAGASRVELPQEEQASLHHQDNIIVVWQPVQAGNTLGWLNLSFALDDIAQLQKQIWKNGIILSLLEILSGVALVYLLLRRPLKSIERLSGFARELPTSKGKTVQVERFVTEIQDLGESLNYASCELAKVENELLELNRTLQLRVEEEVAKSREKDLMLLQQARYQTMGELLVNIAHHWRQPLNAIGASIQQNSYLIANGELSPDAFMEKTDEVMLTLKQLSNSIEGFRQLCMPADSDQLFLPSEAVYKSIVMVEDGYQLQGIELECEVVSESSIKGPLQDLIQCLLNLYSNSAEAMKAHQMLKGLISIRVRGNETAEVEISVRDNAGGISPEIMGTIFDPYVTTKFRSQSVGLGLFVVRQLIETRFGGKIKAENVDAGAELKIVIPVAKGGRL